MKTKKIGNNVDGRIIHNTKIGNDMDDDARLIRALNELADIEDQKRQAAAEDCKREDEATKRRKRLKDYFYNHADPILMHIPKDSLYTDMKDE